MHDLLDDTAGQQPPQREHGRRVAAHRVTGLRPGRLDRELAVELLLAQDDRSPLADNCQYWIGEAFYAMGNYYQAIAEFQKVLPLENSNKSNDAQLMIGISLIKAGEPEVARTELNTVVNFAGNSPSAQKAMRYLKILNNA